MIEKELSTEQVILEAAEAEFLEKGFESAKMMGIAKRAGIVHSMLHYYFRSKENLFQMVFRQKIAILSNMFEEIDEQHLPFFEMIRMIIERQFDFVARNPKLPRFVLNEIISKKENREMVFDVVVPQFSKILGRIEQSLNEEIARGTIRRVKLRDLIMNIVSMNVSTFVFLPVLESISPDMNKKDIQNYLEERRESNVQFILNNLRL
jgi:AcrR family transcriptional regulator